MLSSLARLKLAWAPQPVPSHLHAQCHLSALRARGEDASFQGCQQVSAREVSLVLEEDH